MAKMLRTVTTRDEDGNRVTLTRGTEAPEWYGPNRFVEGFEPDEAGPGDEQHPANGGGSTAPAEMTGYQLVQGSIPTVMGNVNGDPARAARALDAERAGQNRTTLVEALEAVIAGSEDE